MIEAVGTSPMDMAEKAGRLRLMGCHGDSVWTHARKVGRMAMRRRGAGRNTSSGRDVESSLAREAVPQWSSTASSLLSAGPCSPEAHLCPIRGVAQPGSALALGARGPRFKSGRPDQLLQ
jgi:hypothetical protein